MYEHINKYGSKLANRKLDCFSSSESRLLAIVLQAYIPPRDHSLV